MLPLYAMLFILIVYFIGDLVASLTKSLVPSLFTCSVLFLLSFWSGLVPNTLFVDSTMAVFGPTIMTMLLVHMGSMLNLNQLIQQWKTVLIGAAGIIGVVVLLFLVGKPIVGEETVFVAAPPISGGVIAGLQMSKAAEAINRPDLQLMASLLVVIQGFVGYPLASFFLRQEGRKVVEAHRQGHVFEEIEDVEIVEKPSIFKLPDRFRTANYYLAKTAAIAALAVFLSTASKSIATGIGWLDVLLHLDANVLGLIFGILAAHFNILERQPLVKGNSFGLGMATLTILIFMGLANAQPQDILSLAGPLVICLILGAIGIIILAGIMGKILKVSPWMSFAIGITALFGFPGTYVVSNEVASALAANEEEKKVILGQILPKMLVAGFVTVSIGSVILAGFLSNLLVPGM